MILLKEKPQFKEKLRVNNMKGKQFYAINKRCLNCACINFRSASV